jgi:hypothetical protein
MSRSINNFGEHLQVVLRKACEMVGADPEKIDFGEKDWYYSHSWTKDEEDGFVKWMTDYLYKKVSARRELMSLSARNKERCRKAAQQFASFYLWRID